MNRQGLNEILRLHALWLAGNATGHRANLSDADLSRADLSGANLGLANLSDADLSGANLGLANLSDADLRRANLSDANLSDANLYCANLSRADLSGADLSGANLNDANLNDANLNGADLSDANLNDADLRRAKGLPPERDAIRLLDRIRRIVIGNGKPATGQLIMSEWHTCETAHCLAGWAQHLLKLPSVEAGILAIWPAAHMIYATDAEALEYLRERRYAQKAEK